MNCTKKYGNKMGGVGIADNPMNYYRIYLGQGSGSGGGTFYFGMLL